MKRHNNDEGYVEDNTFTGSQNSGNKEFEELRNISTLTSFCLKYFSGNMISVVFATFLGLLQDSEAMYYPWRARKNPQWVFCCGNLTFSRLQLIWSQERIWVLSLLQMQSLVSTLRKHKGKVFFRLIRELFLASSLRNTFPLEKSQYCQLVQSTAKYLPWHQMQSWEWWTT